MMQELQLDKSSWKAVTFGDVVREVGKSTNDPIRDGIKRVVGLEHIESECIHLRSWASIEDATTFTKVFRKGHVLFGRRRAYLKKAAMADFDGICSGDITVLEAKDGLLPVLLPFLVNNDKFFDYAVKHSAGGLSPRTKFKDLANYGFLLPPKDQQAKLAELLWAADAAVEEQSCCHSKLVALLEAERRRIDEGDVRSFRGDEITSLIAKGASPKWQGFSYTDSGMLFVTSENVLYDEIDLKDGKYLPLAFNTKQRRSQLRRRDVLINLVGASIGRLAMFDVEVEVANVNQAVGVFRCDPSKAIPEFIVQYLLKGDNNLRLVNNQSESARPNLSLTDLREFEFRLPSLNEQKKRLIRIQEIKETVKSSKEQLVSSHLLIKALINQIF
jgi:type I restriction enzyme S subunit